MAKAYNLYNKYIRVNGRWERLNEPPVAGGSMPVLNFVKSISATDFLALDLETLNINDVYNVIDEFTTDSRFLEGPSIPAPEGTFVAVIEQGTTKYFNIQGSAFNMDYIQKEIMALLTIIDSISTNWADIENKPFTYVGEGLEVDEDDMINAKALIDDFNEQIDELRNAIRNLNATWSTLTNKPFSTIGEGLSVNENNELNASQLIESINELRTSITNVEVAWNNVTSKPFNYIGEGLEVINDSLQTVIKSVTWDSVKNKPFSRLGGDFYVSSDKLYISTSYSHSPLSSTIMEQLRTIIQS